MVAVGPDNVVLYSEDGVAWSLGRSPVFANLRSVAVHPELGFVAVGDGGVVLSSPDGRQWVGQQSPSGDDLVAVVCSNERIIAATAAGSVVISEDDADTWSIVAVPEASRLVALATRGSAWIVVGNGVWRSDNGDTWTRVDEPEWARPGSGDLAFQDVIDTDNGFALLSNSGVLLSNDDGWSWVFEVVPELDTLGAPWHGDARWRLAAGPETLVVTAGYRYPEPPPWDSYESLIATRSDPDEWQSSRDSGPGPSMMLWMNGWWLALPQEYDRRPISGTLDLETWTPLASKLPARSVGADSVTAVASRGWQLLLAAGESRFNQGWCWTSWDLLNWQPGSAPSLLEEVAWFHPRWLGLAWTGMSLIASHNGLNWSEVAIPSAELVVWHDLAVEGDRVVLVGVSGGSSVVAISHDLEQWQVRFEEEPAFTRVAAIPDYPTGPSGFVALAPNGVVAKSQDGLTWIRESVPYAPDLRDVAASGGLHQRIVAITWDGLVAYRSKRHDWQITDVGHSGLGKVWNVKGDFMVSTSEGFFLESYDGEHWEAVASPVGPVIGVTSLDTQTIIVGSNGAMAVMVRGNGHPRVPVVESLVVPVAATTDGLNGTRWASDLHLANPTDGWTTLTVTVDSLRPGIRTALPPLSATTLSDVVRGAGTDVNGLYPIDVWSTGVTATGSRIWTPLSAGAMAQTVPVLEWRELVRDTGPAVLPYLRETPSHRTNIGLCRFNVKPIGATLEIRGGDGEVLGRQALPPPGGREAVQYTQPTRWFTGEAVEGGYAMVELEPQTHPRWTAWTSVVDNLTGDATFHLAQEPMSNPFVIAAAVHVSGAKSTRWRTDLSLVNPEATEAAVFITPLPAESWTGSTEPILITIPTMSTRLIEDVAAELWLADGAAALLLEPQSGAVAAASRTFTVGADGGTYGQGIPPSALSNPGFPTTWLPGIREDVDHRTNLGLINVGDEPAEVSVTLHHATGVVLMHIDREVPPRSLVQINRPLASLGQPVSDGVAELRVTTPAARIIAWASVVDNHTGDAVFVPGRTQTH